MPKLVAIFLTGFLALALNAETIKVALPVYGRAPFSFPPNSKELGIFPEILNEITKLTGDKFEYTYLPPQRMRTFFDEGKVDVDIGVNPVWRSDSKVESVYSIPFAKAEDVIVFAKGKKISGKDAKAFKGKKIATVRGYIYPGFMKAFADQSISRRDVNSESQALKVLAAGRLDQAFIRKDIALYFIKSDPSLKDLEIGETIGSVDISIRLHINKKSALKRINKAISTLKKNGTLKKIYQKYH